MAGGKADAANARDLADGSEQFGEAQLPFRVAIAVYVLAEQLNLGVALIGDAARLFRTEIDPRLRSLPRVYGTTQYEQNLSQPSMMVM